MRTLTGALAALAFACLAFSANAQTPPACISLEALTEQASDAVESGGMEEAVILKGESARFYKAALAERGMVIPDTVDTLLIVVAKTRQALVLGFVDGCFAGKGVLPPGLHQAVYGREAGNQS